MAKKSVYAVRVGRKTGLFFTWAECEAQVKGFSGAEFKGFGIVSDAQAWLDEGKVATADDITSSPAPDLTELWDNTDCGQDDLPPWELPLTKDEELTAFQAALEPSDSDFVKALPVIKTTEQMTEAEKLELHERMLARYAANHPVWSG